MPQFQNDLDQIAASIDDGVKLAVSTYAPATSLALGRALIRRGVKDIHLVTLPVADTVATGLQTDLLVGSGAVSVLETAGISIGELGPAPRFQKAARSGAITVKDGTCPAIYTGFEAAVKGIPYMPIRGIIGSDIMKFSDSYKLIDNPFDATEKLLAVPAIAPDLVIFHARLADRAGNVWMGTRRDLLTLSYAARRTIVTVEEFTDDDLLADERTAPGVIPHYYLDTIAHAPAACWPALAGGGHIDLDHVSRYIKDARDDEKFAAYLRQHVFEEQQAAEYRHG